jgi:L-lactate dehydrogenase complex protein LldG
MSDRDAMLAAVRLNQPPDVPLPSLPDLASRADDLVERFRAAIAEVGGTLVEVEPDGVARAVVARYPEATHVASAVPELMAGSFPLRPTDDPHSLAALEVLVCRGVVGVAENGAVWLPESRVVHRAAPFLTQHLVIVLDKGAIVGDLHQAYARIRVDQEAFGVFVAGPSKTADIEQILVIGAHGPRSLTVLLVSSAT